MSVRRYKLIFILVFFIHTSAANDPHPAAFQPQWPAVSTSSSGYGRTGRSSQGTPESKNRPVFSPRMEYNEWLPVGRGDPLKNDPTYDYSPPVLDRVRYWSDNLANKDKGNDILLLGVPSKKASNAKAIEQQSQQQSPWVNNAPLRRNYYHHQINQLPTVLMPPPLNNHLQPDGGDGYLWTQASTHQAQRYESPQGEGFRYRQGPPQQQQQPQPVHNFQYTGQKYTEPPMYHMNSFQQQAHPSQQYTTTLRLTTPNDIGNGQKKPILHTILQNEKAYPFTKTAMTNTITEYTSSFYNPQNINAMATTIIHPPQTTEYLITEPTKVFHAVSTSIKAPIVTPATFVTTTTPTTTTIKTSTTTMRPLQRTMDPVLAQFNQPPRAVAPPLYLIIEGHSKVKTYGLNNNDTLMQLPKLVPVVGAEDPVIRHVVNRDNTGDALQVPHVTMKPSTTTTATTPTTRTTPESPSSDEETSEEKSAVNSFLSLLDASFGKYLNNGESGGNSLDSGESDKDSKARRNARSIEDDRQQLYVIGSFQVGDQYGVRDGDEEYRRGVVFDERTTSINGEQQ